DRRSVHAPGPRFPPVRRWTPPGPSGSRALSPRHTLRFLLLKTQLLAIASTYFRACSLVQPEERDSYQGPTSVGPPKLQTGSFRAAAGGSGAAGGATTTNDPQPLTKARTLSG